MGSNLKLPKKSNASTMLICLLAMGLYGLSATSYILQLRSLIRAVDSVDAIRTELIISITLMSLSLLFAINHIRYSFCSTNNMPSDNLKYGHDLTHVDSKPFYELKTFEQLKIFHLPPYNAFCQVIMSMTIFFAKLLLLNKLKDYNLILRNSSTINNDDLLIDSIFTVNVDYVNCIFGLLIFACKYTQVYIYVNKAFFAIIGIRLAFFLLINTIFLKFVESNFFNSNLSFLNFLLIKNTTRSAYVLMPSVATDGNSKPTKNIENFLLVFICYLVYYLVNCLYLMTLSVYFFHHYQKAQVKIKSKFEHVSQFKCSKNNIVSSVGSLISSSSIVEFGNRPSILKRFRSIILAIFLFILLQMFHVPFLLKFYQQSEFNVQYCLIVTVILLDFLHNTVLLIVFSVKSKWHIEFTFKYRIMLWYALNASTTKQDQTNRTCLLNMNVPKLLVRDEMNLSSNTISQQSDYSATNTTCISQHSNKTFDSKK